MSKKTPSQQNVRIAKHVFFSLLVNVDVKTDYCEHDDALACSACCHLPLISDRPQDEEVYARYVCHTSCLWISEVFSRITKGRSENQNMWNRSQLKVDY